MCFLNRKYIVLVIIICLGFVSRANNVLVEVTSFENFGLDSVKIDLSLSWENSWSEKDNVVNHDAVWFFAKVKRNGRWSHLTLGSVSSLDFTISKSLSRAGCIIKPESDSYGHLSVFLKRDFSEIHFSSIEMVAVNEGEFYLGDRVSNHAFTTPDGESFLVKNEEAILKSTELTSLTPTSVAANIPDNFPKGYEGFYCMKYEVTQGQIVDFLNHLTLEEQKLFLGNELPKVGETALSNNTQLNFNGVVVSGMSSEAVLTYSNDLNKNGIYNESNDGLDLACNFLSWKQLQQYLDWCGLRPMSEFEYEKASRGSVSPVEKEFAFGTDKIKDANSLVDEFTNLETHTSMLTEGEGIGVHGYDGRQGPLRVGFGANASSNRIASGASYWGIMELSGNLWEQTVSVSKQNGLLFTGSHGDGDLLTLSSDWKDQSNIVRGGAWNSGVFLSFRDLAVSDRYYYQLATENARNTTGGRGVISFKFLRQ